MRSERHTALLSSYAGRARAGPGRGASPGGIAGPPPTDGPGVLPIVPASVMIAAPDDIQDEQDEADRQGAAPEVKPGHDVPGGDGDHDDQCDEEQWMAPVPAPSADDDVGRLGYLGVRQVVEQPGQVGAGLGPHRLIDALVELGLVEAAVAVVLGQPVGDLRALGVGDPQVGLAVAEPAAK